MIEGELKTQKSKSKIKVKHTVVVKTLDLDKIFWCVISAAKTVYATAEAEQEAVLAAKCRFEKDIQCIISQAFRTGKKIGHYKADSKDTEMYVEPTCK